MAPEKTLLKDCAYRLAVRPIARVALVVMLAAGGLYCLVAPYLNRRDTNYYEAVNRVYGTSKYPNIKPTFRWPWE